MIAGVVEQRDVGRFSGVPGKWLMPRADTATGCSFEQIVQDREVMDRQVGDHVHVALEQAEVHADRVVIEDLAQIAAVDDLAHLPHGAGVDEGVVDDAASGCACRPPRPAGAPASAVSVIGFSSQTCLPAFSAAMASSKCVRTGVAMAMASIEGSAISSCTSVVMLRRREPPLGQGQFLRIQVGDGDDLASAQFREVADEVGPPIAVADNSDVDHVTLPQLFRQPPA